MARKNFILRGNLRILPEDDRRLQKLLDMLVVRCLMGIQEGLNKSQEFLVEETAWMVA